MDRLIYTALTGLRSRARAQVVTANNLANASTTSFRREIIAAEGHYFTGTPARAQTGAPSITTPREAGRITSTGCPLDIALDGDAWLAVQGPQLTEAYTRRGDLSVAASGVLQTGDSRAVLGTDGRPITVPAGADLAITPDGALSTLANGVATPVGQLKLVAGGTLASGFDKGLDGLFTAPTALPADPAARITIGALEASNVSATAALVDLVEESRGFEVNARLLSTARDMDERTARLMMLEA